MAYTRKIYDENAYKKELQESTEPGRYSLLEDSTYSNETCFQQAPEIHSGLGQYRISEQNDMVNVESDLFNLIRKDSKDPQQDYPYIKKEYSNAPKIDTCNKTDLSRQYPLLEAPVFKREQSIHVPRFESLCLNPQDMSRIRANSYIGLNSRLFFRDNHKTKNPILKDQTKVLPMASEDFKSPMEDFLGYTEYLQNKKKKDYKKENFKDDEDKDDIEDIKKSDKEKYKEKERYKENFDCATCTM